MINCFAAGQYHAKEWNSLMTKKEKAFHFVALIIYTLGNSAIGIVLVIIAGLKWLWLHFNYLTHLAFYIKLWTGGYKNIFVDENQKKELFSHAYYYAKHIYVGMKPDLSARHELHCLAVLFKKNNQIFPELLGACEKCFGTVHSNNRISDNIYKCEHCGATQFDHELGKMKVGLHGVLYSENEFKDIAGE